MLTIVAMCRLDFSDLGEGFHRRYSSDYGQSIHDSMQDCRIVVIDNNELAIAFGAARDKYVVCFLQGGQSLCILRPCQGSHWKLINEDGYVLGAEKFHSIPTRKFCRQNHLFQYFPILHTARKSKSWWRRSLLVDVKAMLERALQRFGFENERVHRSEASGHCVDRSAR
jgi:hypothetical protein